MFSFLKKIKCKHKEIILVFDDTYDIYSAELRCVKCNAKF